MPHSTAQCAKPHRHGPRLILACIAGLVRGRKKEMLVAPRAHSPMTNPAGSIVQSPPTAGAAKVIFRLS
jgi:hypothetical protein